MNVEDVPAVVAQLLRRPTRWAPEQMVLGEFDGSKRLLQVFKVELADQLRFLALLNPYRSSLEGAAGGTILVMFFSPKQSLRYQDFLKTFTLQPSIHRVQEHRLAPLGPGCVDIDNASGPHRRVA